jgi:hypothetical protein
MTLINKIKNWWNPFGHEKKSQIFSWKLDPKEDITAYELFLCNKQPYTLGYKSVIEYQEAINKWYNDLPSNCRRHLKSLGVTCIEYCKYGE